MNKKAKGNFGMFLIILALLGLIFYFFIYENGIHNPFKHYSDNLEDPYINQMNGCINSGGSVTLNSCCGTVGDFPNTCLIGACGCSPFSSHQIRICYCGQGKCFNGKTCILYNQCDGLGSPDCVCPLDAVKVSGETMCEIPPCPMSYSCRYSECKVNGDCQSGLCSGNGKCYPYDKPLMNAQICNSAGGRWNECGNICQIMNQGKNVACPAVCGAICECGGIMGLRCPFGYECITPNGISDAMGYCDSMIKSIM